MENSLYSLLSFVIRRVSKGMGIYSYIEDMDRYRNRWKDQDYFVIFYILLSPPLTQGEEEQENKLHDCTFPTVNYILFRATHCCATH